MGERMMADDSCGKRFMTNNSGGCACYPVNLASCLQKGVAGRLTWDFVPVPSSTRGGYFLPDQKLHSGKRCQDILWKYTAGDAFDCLEKLMTEGDTACGTTYMTWNSANGGCACYPHEQDTCTTTRESGRETYEIQFDASYRSGDLRSGDLQDQNGGFVVFPGVAFFTLVLALRS